MSSAIVKSEPAPTRAQFGKLQEVKTIGQALAHPEMIKRIREAVPRHLPPERMLRVMAQAVHKTPKLAECNMMSLLGAMVSLASLGLEPNNPLGHAYLIPFDKREKNPQTGRWEVAGTDVQVVIGYRGLIDLARRSGALQSIHADVSYEGDEFSFEFGSNMHLRHKPMGSREGRKPEWVYCYVKLEDGEAFDVLPYEDVLKIRDASEGYKSALRAKSAGNQRAYQSSPWVAYEHEMLTKTMVRRLSKALPMSIEFATAVSLDESGDRAALDYSKMIEVPFDTSTIESVAAIAEQVEDPMSEIKEEAKPQTVSREEARQAAFEQDSMPKAQPTGNKPAPAANQSTEAADELPPAMPDQATVIDDLRMYLQDAEDEQSVDAVIEGFGAKMLTLDMVSKQEAMDIIERARKRVKGK